MHIVYSNETPLHCSIPWAFTQKSYLLTPEETLLTYTSEQWHVNLVSCRRSCLDMSWAQRWERAQSMFDAARTQVQERSRYDCLPPIPKKLESTRARFHYDDLSLLPKRSPRCLVSRVGLADWHVCRNRSEPHISPSWHYATTPLSSLTCYTKRRPKHSRLPVAYQAARSSSMPRETWRSAQASTIMPCYSERSRENPSRESVDERPPYEYRG